MPAAAGAAIVTRRLAIRMRDGFLWQPKGFLPEQVALIEKARLGGG